MHRLVQSQILPVAPAEAWAFVATPANLNEVTPPDLGFEIVSPLPATMYNGLLIEYRVRIPGLGRWRWLSEIKHLEPGRRFVDEQRVGPYRMWYHEHEIEPGPQGGTRMTDRVTYALPLGPLGRLLHALVVRRMLDRIFSYRRQVLTARWPAVAT